MGLVHPRHITGLAPWYPVIHISLGQQKLTDTSPGQFRGHMLRDNLNKLFEKAGLEPMSPHEFRHGHAVYGLKAAKDVSDLKAVSMNLMHSTIGITDQIYAVPTDRDMQERIAKLGQEPTDRRGAGDVESLLREVLSKLSNHEAR